MNNTIYNNPILLKILEDAPLPIGIYEGPELRFVFINKAGAEAIRKSKEEILGRPYGEVLPHAIERVASVKRVYETGEKFSQNEMPLPLGFDEDGKPIIDYVSFLSQPVYDVKDKIIGVASFGFMVTEEVVARNKLAESAHRTSQILEHLSTGFFSVDKNWNFTYSNPAAIPALGFPFSELKGKSVWEVHPDLVGTEFYHAYHKSMKDRVVVEVQNYYPEQDKWYHTTSYPLDEGIAVSFTDVTVRKKSEEARALSDERFHTLTEALPQMVWITESDGKVVYFNQRWMEKTGTSLEVNLGHGWLNVVHPDDRENTIKVWNEREKTNVYDIEYRLRMADGSYRWHLARGVPTIGEDKKIKQWVGSTTDIQNQKDAQEQLKRAVVARDEFLSIASHELKTPLTIIKLQADLTKRTLGPDIQATDLPRISKFADTTERNVQRLTRVVDDMLDISRVSTGKLNIELEEVNFRKVLDETMERMTPILKDAGCRVEYSPGSDVRVRLDKFRIEQVLINLLTNAARYGKGRPVHVSFGTNGQTLVIKVKDNGAGISPEDHERIFERFERATKTADGSGLGLGLFIVKNIIDLHHGTVRVESGLNSGATFIVELPLTQN